MWVTDSGRFRYFPVCNCRHSPLCEIEQSQSPKLKCCEQSFASVPLEKKVYKQNNHKDGPNAYSENTHCSVLIFPYLLWAGINLVPVTHRDTTGDGCGCYT
jgi:hypothetical protein